VHASGCGHRRVLPARKTAHFGFVVRAHLHGIGGSRSGSPPNPSVNGFTRDGRKSRALQRRRCDARRRGGRWPRSSSSMRGCREDPRLHFHGGKVTESEEAVEKIMGDYLRSLKTPCGELSPTVTNPRTRPSIRKPIRDAARGSELPADLQTFTLLCDQHA